MNEVPVSSLIVPVVLANRLRSLYHKPEKGLTLALKAQARYLVGRRKASIAVDKGFNKKFKMQTPEKVDLEQAGAMLPGLIEGRIILEAHRKMLEKQISKDYLPAIKTRLPRVTALFVAHRGVSDLTYGQILAEAGVIEADGHLLGLERFRSPAAFWKRFGLGLIDGERQRLVAGNAELAIRHGYSPQRRSSAWQIGMNLVMCRDEFYSDMYKRRKEHELTKDIKPKHADARARRYITKHFLKRFYLAYCADLREG